MLGVQASSGVDGASIELGKEGMKNCLKVMRVCVHVTAGEDPRRVSARGVV